jgi:hypothetical protein
MSFTFFAIGGAVLIVSGGLQLLVRPRDPGETGLQRLINRATVRAFFFVAVGVLAVLVGLGVIPLGSVGF